MVTKKSLAIGISLIPHISEKTDLEFEFDYSNTLYNTNPSGYSSYTGRFGVSKDYSESFNFSWGLNGGADSSNYIMAGADAGVLFYLPLDLTLSVSYDIVFNIDSTSLFNAKASKKKTNPFSTANTFISQSLAIDITYSF